MKHVNVDPALEKKGEEIQERFQEEVHAAAEQAQQSGEKVSVSPEELKERVIAALKTVYDPEIPVNIYDLGLIYHVGIMEDAFVEVDMTLTAPGCPVAQTFPGLVEGVVKQVSGVNDARVELVWDPPWDQERISEAARLQLGLM